jgi:hypothetical protein
MIVHPVFTLRTRGYRRPFARPGEDGLMNSSTPESRRADTSDVGANTVRRPSSLLIVGGALLALLVAMLANELAHQAPVMRLGALTLFAAGATVMVWLGARLVRHAWPLGQAEVSQRRPRDRYQRPDAGSILQLGRDPEKEIGRETGARV